MLITAVGAAIAAVVALALFVPELRLAGRTETLPAQQPRQQQQPQAPAAGAEPRRAGSLAASGFVVARRKATIASEITGKVVEVLIEEGMTVQAGDVVARLDSMLAERTSTSRSRAAGGGSRHRHDQCRPAGRRADPRAHAEPVAEELRERSRSDPAQARVGVLTAQLARRSRSSRPPGSTRSAAPRCSTSTRCARRSRRGCRPQRAARRDDLADVGRRRFTRTGICTIVDMDSIEVEVDVNEAFIGRVKSGGTSCRARRLSGMDHSASVIAIVPTANREKATVKVRIGFKQKDPRILPDMGIKVTFLDETDGATSAVETSSAH